MNKHNLRNLPKELTAREYHILLCTNVLGIKQSHNILLLDPSSFNVNNEYIYRK